MAQFFHIFFHFVTLLLSSCLGSELALKNDAKPATCGVSKVSRIVGGTAAQDDHYPWFVALMKPESYHDQHFSVSCGAALITPKHVLTAAHCYGDMPYKDRMLVILNLKNRCTKGGKILEVAKLDVHDKFTMKSVIPSHDIALIHLKEEVSNMPICLPSKGRYAGEKGMIIGFGSTLMRTTYPCQMQHAQVEIIPRMECTKRTSMRIPIADRTICAGVLSGGIDSCDGDSGGPLMVNNGGTYELIGVVSYGDGCARERSPGIYTDITKRGFLDWIEERLGKSKPSEENSQPSEPPKPTLDNSPSFSDSDFKPELPESGPFPFLKPSFMTPDGQPYPPVSPTQPLRPENPFGLGEPWRPRPRPPPIIINGIVRPRPRPRPPPVMIGPDGLMMGNDEMMAQMRKEFMRRIRMMQQIALQAMANAQRPNPMFM